MKNHLVTMILVLILVVLQWLIWAPDGPQAKLAEQDKTQQAYQQRSQELAERNAAIKDDIEAFRSNPDAVEAKARQDLGMISKDETYLFIPIADEEADEQ